MSRCTAYRSEKRELLRSRNVTIPYFGMFWWHLRNWPVDLRCNEASTVSSLFRVKNWLIELITVWISVHLDVKQWLWINLKKICILGNLPEDLCRTLGIIEDLLLYSKMDLTTIEDVFGERPVLDAICRVHSSVKTNFKALKVPFLRYYKKYFKFGIFQLTLRF